MDDDAVEFDAVEFDGVEFFKNTSEINEMVINVGAFFCSISDWACSAH